MNNNPVPDDYPITIHPEPADLSTVELHRVELGIALHKVLMQHNEPNKIVLLKPDPISIDGDVHTFAFNYGNMMPPAYNGECRVRGDMLISVTVEDFPDSPSF
jgi:hypothetical protein